MLRFLIVLQIICDAEKYLLRCKISVMLQNICYAAKYLQFAGINRFCKKSAMLQNICN